MLRVPPLAALPLAAVLSAAVLSAAGVRAQQPAHGAASEAPAAPAHVDAFVQELCIDCHGGGTVKGSLDLTRQPVDEVDRLWRWSRMRDRVLAGEMPPPDETAPTEAERARFAEWVAAELARRVPALPADPGRVTVRRLSRGQWRNAVRDLLGIDAPIDGFPADDLGYGFDSIGDALSFSTLHLETYLAAARRVSAAVFHGEVPGAPERRRLEAERMHVVDDRGVDQRGDVANLYTNATLTDTVAVPRDGEYRVRVVAAGRQAGDEPARMQLEVDGRAVERFDVAQDEPADFEAALSLRGGAHRIAVSFVNDYYDPKHPDPRRRDRNLLIDLVDVVGPLDPRPVPSQQAWLHAAADGRTDIARLRSQVRAMLPRLWRRPVAGPELQRVQRAGVDLLRAGAPMLEAQRFVLTAALTSPNFLFRVEPEGAGRGARELSDHALASRLSFFLWASAPDEELQRLAAAGRLDTGDALAEQVDRMLADPRADRLATDFAAQWLELRQLDDVTPDPERFPGFDAALRRALRRETELLFLAVLREGRDVRALLDAEFTHVDATLARFYGLADDVRGDGDPHAFVRVALAGADRVRGGVLGHASVLTVTSNPTRTSPVKRGKWILENLLGQGPPPPPPGNDSFADEAGIDSSASLREQMARHRESSKCAVCHVRMDALGLALERFDAIGRRREQDRGGAVDATGELPDGTVLDGLADLKRVLVADPSFVRALACKLFVYAVGRDLRPVDRLRVDLAVRERLAAGEVTLRDLILLVVRDVAFRRATAD